MELSFLTEDLRAISAKRQTAAGRIGYAAATELSRVIADMEAVDSFPEFNDMFGRMIESVGADEKKFVMTQGYSVVFRSGHFQNLGLDAQPTNWSDVTRIKITAIERTNG